MRLVEGRHPDIAHGPIPAKKCFSWDWGLYLVSSSPQDDRPKSVI